MKSLATKLFAMLVVTMILNTLAINVTFVTSDPMIGEIKTMAVDSITSVVNEMLNYVVNHI